jgi:CheY-like chemotaxis protein
MEVVGTLAGGVAHDLNNILSGIVSYPDLIMMDLPEESPLRKPIQTIKKSGERAAAIVQDLLTLARRGVVATEVMNLNQIVDSYLNSPECEFLKKIHPGVKIESDLERNLLNILGSPVHLSKTVMNLVSNAAEAMPDGGKIFISTKSKYVDKPIKGYDDVKEGDYVILTVSDKGVGISSENIERIFEPFYTKKMMGKSGTGLGMAVVWGTVKDHRGYIDVQSEEGRGTTFTLYFPVTRKKPAGREEALLAEEYMGSGESILVVDDVEEQREIASGILRKLGYSVTTVSSGEEAVDYLKDRSADLLLLDMIMEPGIDGLETYKRILELHPAQKAIIASGYSETDRVKEAQRLGAGKYVMKPYTLEKIGIIVKKTLDSPHK